MSFEKVVIQKKLDDGSYIEDYPRTSQEMILNLLNSSTKSLIGLEESATADDAFKQLYLANVLNGKSMVELTLLDSETNKPLSGIVVSCDKFCDAAGTALTEHTSDNNGKIVAFVSAINPIIKIKYIDMDLTQTLAVDALGKQYTFTITPNLCNYKLLKSSQTIMFSNNVNFIDYTIVGGGGGGAVGHQTTDNNDDSVNYGDFSGNGGYAKTVNNVSIDIKNSYSVIIGAPGNPGWSGYGSGTQRNPTDGGSTVFMGETVKGGGSGNRDTAHSGQGNGYGGRHDLVEINYDNSEKPIAPTRGSVLGYISYDQQDYFGGRGLGFNSGNKVVTVNYRSQEKCTYKNTSYTTNPTNGNGQDGYGGGGSGSYGGYGKTFGGRGGSGGCAIRMHLKSRS